MGTALSTELNPLLPTAAEIVLAAASVVSLILTVVTIVVAIVQVRRRLCPAGTGMAAIVLAVLVPIVGSLVGLLMLSIGRPAKPPVHDS